MTWNDLELLKMTKSIKKVKFDGRTNGPTDGRKKWVVESRARD